MDLDDYPEDLYIIEGDVDAFDDSTFNADELDGAVCVQLNDRQLRYSRLPSIPLFGRAAREQRLELLRAEREQVAEEYAKAAFDSQKLQRLYQSYNEFVSKHIHIAFNDDPEQQFAEVRDGLNQVVRQLASLDEKDQQQRSQMQTAKQALAQLDKLANVMHLIEDESLAERLEEINDKLEQLTQYKSFAQQHGKAADKLSNMLSALEADPEQFDSLQAQYQQADQNLQTLKTQMFALADLHERRHYFAYSDSVSLLDQKQ